MSEQKLTRRQRAEQALENPNVKRMLDLLSWAEGTEKHGYHNNFGGSRLDDLSWHPNKVLGQTKDGKTTATGRYQFLGSTWNEQAKKLNLTDFGERNQDIAAVGLIMDRGALDDVINGDVMKAVYKLRHTWSSLPDNPSKNQPHKSHKDVFNKWNSLGGKADPAFSHPDTGLFHLNGQQYDYSTTKPAHTALQYIAPNAPLTTFTTEEDEAYTAPAQTDLTPAFTELNSTINAFAPPETLTDFQPPEQPDYSEKLAAAFGITPSTKGKIPPHIDDMIRSIYEQTA